MPPLDPTKSLVVYVDDDSDDLQFVQESLQPYQHSLQVLTYESPSKAYEFFLHLEVLDQKPCLIILDMNMPGMSGTELLPILRAIPHYDDTPIIMFTTSNSKLDAIFAKKYKSVLVTKPMNYDQMKNVANVFLSHCTDEIRERLKDLEKK